MRAASLLLLLCSCPSWATWSIVQVKGNFSCFNTSTCAVSGLSAVTSGNLLVGVVSWQVSTHITNMTGGTFVHCTNCAGGNATPKSFVDMGYVLSATGGDTSITFTTDALCPTGCTVIVWELAHTQGPISFDTSGLNLITSNCTTCTGVTLSPTGSNDAIIAMSSCSGTCSGVSSPYVADSPSGTSWPNGNAPVHYLNTTSGTAPTYTQSPTDSFVTAAMAFTEAASSVGASLKGLFSIFGSGSVH